jgi:hypothetical protein
MALPAMVALPTGEDAGCFCPACLGKVMASGLNGELMPEDRSDEGDRQSVDRRAG